jgi:hypothetical protein
VDAVPDADERDVMDTEPEYLDIGGFREWLPLELELDSDQYVE